MASFKVRPLEFTGTERGAILRELVRLGFYIGNQKMLTQKVETLRKKLISFHNEHE